MMKVPIPNFVRCITDEFSSGPFGCTIECVVADKEGVFCFTLGVDDGGGIVSNGGVGRWTWGNGKWVAPSCRVRSGWLDDAN